MTIRKYKIQVMCGGCWFETFHHDNILLEYTHKEKVGWSSCLWKSQERQAKFIYGFKVSCFHHHPLNPSDLILYEEDLQLHVFDCIGYLLRKCLESGGCMWGVVTKKRKCHEKVKNCNKQSLINPQINRVVERYAIVKKSAIEVGQKPLEFES